MHEIPAQNGMHPHIYLRDGTPTGYDWDVRRLTAYIHNRATHREKLHYSKDNNLDSHLLLIGPATNYAPDFIFAFEGLGRIGIGKDRGKYRIESMTHIGCEKETLIHDSDSNIRDSQQMINTINKIHEASQLNHHRIVFRPLAPIRIGYKTGS